MNESKLQWAKTLMGTYKYLDRIAGAIDKVFERRAKNSFYSTSKNVGLNSAFNLTNNLLNLMESKVKVINMKILISDCLLSMPRQYAQILVYKYIDNKTSQEISEILNFSQRTYFRKLNDALFSFRSELLKNGFCDSKLYEMLKTENWIMEVYNDNKDTKNDQNIITDAYIISICTSFKKLAVSY